MLFGELDDSEEYLYHYTRARNLPCILKSGVLRLGSYLRTNDPREAGSWQYSLTREGPGTIDVDRYELKASIRARVKIACLTQDYMPEQPVMLLNRGWARPRMWAQYARHHRGVCLVFLKSELDKEFDALRQRIGFGLQSPVEYSDATFNIGDIAVSVDDLETRGENATIDALIRDKGGLLFFQKSLDWATEREYRYLVTSDAEFETLSIRKALVGVVLGQGFRKYVDSELHTLLAKEAYSGVKFARLGWVDGHPYVHFDPYPWLRIPELSF